ncbi:S16 family serine protease [Rubritalea tangerina]
MIGGQMVGSAAEVGRKQTGVKGLLVMDLGNGEYAGTASQMNATVIKKPSLESLEVAFNQDVGELMSKATKEVVKFINVRHDEVPVGYRVEFAFADQYSPKDGPSAAVATALMLESIITGVELADDFAVTGDMNATGAVRPVGGVMSKVRGASKKCKVVAIPEANVSAIRDAYIIEGPSYLSAIQIFSIKNFDQAYALAGERGLETEKAIADFSAVQKALRKNPKYVYNGKVKAKLKEVLDVMPNHVSAKLLLQHGMKQGPKKLSLSGSIVAIDSAAVDFSKMLKNQQFVESGGSGDVLFSLISDLRKLKHKVDPRTREYCDSYIDLAEHVKLVRGKKVWTPQNERELRAAIREMTSARDELLKDRAVREELMED